DDKFIRDDIEVEAQDDKFVRDDIEVGVQGDSIHEAQGDTNKEEFKDVYIVAWTTTPWTIPSNFAVCVNPNYDYCLVKFEGEYLIIAKARLEYTFYTKQENIGTENGNLVQILAEFKGTELEGLQYEPVYDYFKNDSSEKDYHVYLYDGVTIEDGTGVLHVAPAFGEEDFELGQKFGLSGIHDIDSEGKMTVGDWVGIYLRDASPMIAEDLQKRGNLLRSEMHKHRLPFYRGDNPLIYMTQDSYFINIQKIKDRMLDLNKNINWTPENIKDGRFGQTISTSPDWSISRNRYWATIIPVWKNEDGEELVIGSIEEMTQYTDQVIKKEVDGKVEYSFDGQPMDLHRDVCDKIVLVKEGKKYTRIPEVLDCWMDSGSVPFAEHHYPFEHKEEFENAFPADFIVEYVGQVRAWFNVLLRVSTMIFDNQSFNNVICTGVMAGNDGRKMSKSYGNYPDPKDVLNKIGGEAVRLYLMGSTLMVGGDMNWSDEILNEQVKNVLIPIWNVYKYLAIYAELHEWTPENTDFNSTNVLDQWLETYMNKVTSDYSTAMENYNIPESVKLIQPAVDNISSWWIRRSRDRFVAGDKEALQTLYVTIVQFIKTFAPQMPFLTEEIYQNLVSGCGLKSSKESIHLELFPVVDFKKVNTKLLEDMALVREICTLGLKVRDDNRLKLRQPLAKAVLVASEKMILTDEKLIGIIKEELNVKEFQLASKESLLEGLVSNTDGEITIALDTVLSPELREEGLLNELVRAIQNLRKTSGFKMGELVNISVKLSGNDLLNVINKHNSEICKSVSASSFSVVTDLTDGKSVKIEDEEVVFSLIK
ncbi:MAG: class I tRNA ligase family protein, partial [bacterium]